MSAESQVRSHREVLGVRTSTHVLLGDTIRSLTDGDVSTLGDMSLGAGPSPGYLLGTGSDSRGSQGERRTLQRASPEAAVSTPRWVGALTPRQPLS